MGLKQWFVDTKDRFMRSDIAEQFSPEPGTPRIVLTPDESGNLRATRTTTLISTKVALPEDQSMTNEEQNMYRVRQLLLRETEDQRGERMLRWLTSWPVLADKWPYSYGTAAKFVTCTVSGVYIINCYRRHFKLGQNMKKLTWLCGAVMPAVFNIVFQHEFVTIPMLGSVTSRDPCPVCYEMRALALQVGHSYVFPATGGLLLVLFVARQYLTAPTPTLIPLSRRNTKFALSWIATTMKPVLFGRIGLTVLALNVAFVFFWSHFEFYNMHKIAMKMRTHRELVTQLGEKQGRFKEHAALIPPGAPSRTTSGYVIKELPSSEAVQPKVNVTAYRADDTVLNTNTALESSQEPFVLPDVPKRDEKTGWLSFLTKSTSGILSRPSA